MASQAAVYLANFARRVTILNATDNIGVRYATNVVAVEGDGPARLTRDDWTTSLPGSETHPHRLTYESALPGICTVEDTHRDSVKRATWPEIGVSQ
jgi:hypothetical protein